MNHPKGLTVDDKGNIYIADTMNMAIRKISDTGVTTIAGGKWSHGGGHVDGASEDAKFSNDFDVVYVGSSCSLLVIDRGNRAIREIQLHFDDCAYQYGSSFPLGMVVLLAAGCLGYMLALLQRRMGAVISSRNDEDAMRSKTAGNPYKKPLKSVRPPLIPTGDEPEKLEENFFGSLRKLFANARESAVEILRATIPSLKKPPVSHQHQQKHTNTWPVQDSFVIPDEDEPPSLETRTPTPKKTYPFMSKDAEKMHQWRQGRAFYSSGWDDGFQQKQQHHHQYQSSEPHTFYEQSHEKTDEIVFGAVQEQDGESGAAVVSPVDYRGSLFSQQSVRFRSYGPGYGNGY